MLLLLSFILLLAGPISATTPTLWCNNEELEALAELRITLSGKPLHSWDLAISCCSWRGIQCGSSLKDDDDSRRFTQLSTGFRVRALTLPDSGLTGSIPPSISKLRALQAVDLSRNQISGSIPGSLATLPRLLRLDLSGNNFSSELPPAFTDGFTELQRLNLSGNLLQGPVTPVRASESLDLSFNFFTGSLPDPMPCSRAVNLSYNELSGDLLGSFAGCGALLHELSAQGNQLNSTIYPELHRFSAGLRVLDLSYNEVRGEIPEGVGSLGLLEELNLGYNYLRGRVPGSISNCTRLRLLSLRNNDFRGGIDHLDFPRLGNLSQLDLSYNQLRGDIPPGIARCTRLESVALARNMFRGNIPGELGALRSLKSLLLSGNELSGGIPGSLQECGDLKVLVLSKNRFTEPLPDGNLTGFRSLQLLAIGNSGLPGGIPGWISNCSRLQVLDLSWNRLSGEIPGSIGVLEHLFYLDLSNNTLHGGIPVGIVKLRALSEGSSGDQKSVAPVANTLFVKHKSNTSALQYNQVSAFPPSIIFSGNKLEGEIPRDFGRLRNLVSLDLSNNQLTGMIPASLANASDLESLDLSLNKLTGRIPGSLAKLTFLAFFNVSFNQLSGSIPNRNQFASFSNLSYTANAGLCGSPLTVLCGLELESPRDLESSSSRRMNRGAIMGVTISISLGLTALFAALLMLSHSRRHRRDPEGPPEDFKALMITEMMSVPVTMFAPQNQSPRRVITVGDLIRATNNFDPANIIGCGGFGLVFKANLPDGSVVAIKRLSSEDGAMEKEFDAELSILGKIKHRNLVSLQGYCRLGLRDRLLVYSFMENGSLDYWLHERSDGGGALTWHHRLEILRETARGLEYLHRGCDPHVVHRDIKSSNILLDGEFRAHVADFGLARLIPPLDTHVSTELVGTLGYIPPEYAESSVATLRGDVYSFGVLVLEVLSRRRPVDACRRGGVRDLVPWVRAMQGSGRGIEIVDPLLLTQNNTSVNSSCCYLGKGAVEEMMRVLDVACYCIDVCPQRRPGIEEVVVWLDCVGAGAGAGKRKK